MFCGPLSSGNRLFIRLCKKCICLSLFYHLANNVNVKTQSLNFFSKTTLCPLWRLEKVTDERFEWSKCVSSLKNQISWCYILIVHITCLFCHAVIFWLPKPNPYNEGVVKLQVEHCLLQCSCLFPVQRDRGKQWRGDFTCQVWLINRTAPFCTSIPSSKSIIHSDVVTHACTHTHTRARI